MADKPTKDPLLKDAQAIQAWLIDNKDDHEVDQIAKGTNIDPDRVRTILDSWVPDSNTDEGVREVGPGAGGPWIEVPADPPLIQIPVASQDID